MEHTTVTRAALDAAYAETDAWRAAMRGAKMDNILGMSERDATCVVSDEYRKVLTQTPAQQEESESVR